MLYERPRFTLQQHDRLPALQSVPDVLRNIYSISAVLLTDDAGFHDLALVIVGRHPDLSLQYHKGLVLVGMVMYGDKSARFQGIEETVTLILQTLMEVVVLPQLKFPTFSKRPQTKGF